MNPPTRIGADGKERKMPVKKQEPEPEAEIIANGDGWSEVSAEPARIQTAKVVVHF